LIVRDLMVRGLRTYQEFMKSGEGIATNILANRLKRLRAAGIVSTRRGQRDKRQVEYRLTEKGIALAPVLLELLVWGSSYEQTGVPCGAIAEMAKDREGLLAEVRRRWQEDDRTPLLPWFNIKTPQGNGTKRQVTGNLKTRGASNERRTGTGGHAQRRIHPELRRQTR
jgi:DNA-binding HxlR family transcriptional regulator